MERRSDSVKARQSTRFDVEINARQEGENNLSPFTEGGICAAIYPDGRFLHGRESYAIPISCPVILRR